TERRAVDGQRPRSCAKLVRGRARAGLVRRRDAPPPLRLQPDVFADRRRRRTRGGARPRAPWRVERRPRVDERERALLSREVAGAQRSGAATVALETTLVAHGFPAGEGLEVALEAERRVREAGAVPATIGIVDGAIRVGLSEAELARFAAAGEEARKVGPR